jgi:tetratricopeptide (TPR) repeat protein
VTQAAQSNPLPTILAGLRQQRLDGELVLEQNDGVRRMHWRQGELVYLQSDAAGEQFGNYLLRQGILDFPVLNQLLLSEERFRLGEKVVQWGLMTIEERDSHLQLLQEQVMVHALEHPIIQLTWNPGSLNVKLSDDLHLQLDHRHFIWNTFLEAHDLQDSLDQLAARTDWRWEGIPGLLETLSDLPLTPASAYALSFLGAEPISFDTFQSLSDLDEAEAARIILSLWAVGGLILTQGESPAAALQVAEAPAPQAEPAPTVPLAPAPPAVPAPPQPAEPPPDPFLTSQLEASPLSAQPEFLELEADPAPATPQPPQSPLEKARILHRTARHYLLQDRTGEAIRCLEQAVQLDPASPAAFPVWLLLGKLRMVNPAWSTRSINALQAASRIQPKAADPWVAMGEVYYRKGFRTNAVACFHKALELDPSVPIPPEVDYRDLEAELPPEPAPVQPTSLFSRFKSILGGSDKV